MRKKCRIFALRCQTADWQKKISESRPRIRERERERENDGVVLHDAEGCEQRDCSRSGTPAEARRLPKGTQRRRRDDGEGEAPRRLRGCSRLHYSDEEGAPGRCAGAGSREGGPRAGRDGPALSEKVGREGYARRAPHVLLVPIATEADPRSLSPSTLLFPTSQLPEGLLAEEEERLITLRFSAEDNAKRLDSEVKQEIERVIERARLEGEAEAKKSFERSNSLCATPYGIDIVGITEGIALIGALVGGVAAKSRKDEVQKLNDQLRTINIKLRKQARSGIVYAPDMNYAPPSTGGGSVMVAEPPAAMAPAEVAEDVEKAEVAEEATEDVPKGASDDETLGALRKGRRLLELKKGAAALVHFEKARLLSRSEGNKGRERRAERGLAAASRMQRQFKKAIGHLERVLEISEEMDEYTGDADAYGAIADIWTELGDFERAAKFYDKYIENMNLN